MRRMRAIMLSGLKPSPRNSEAATAGSKSSSIRPFRYCADASQQAPDSEGPTKADQERKKPSHVFLRHAGICQKGRFMMQRNEHFGRGRNRRREEEGRFARAGRHGGERHEESRFSGMGGRGGGQGWNRSEGSRFGEGPYRDEGFGGEDYRGMTRGGDYPDYGARDAGWGGGYPGYGEEGPGFGTGRESRGEGGYRGARGSWGEGGGFGGQPLGAWGEGQGRYGSSW